MAHNGPKLPQNDLKMASNDPKRPKRAPKWHKLAQNGLKMAPNGLKWKIFVFFEVLGAFRPPNSAKLFLGQPHYSALRKKKVRIFFFDRQWVQTTAKPLFIEIEI